MREYVYVYVCLYCLLWDEMAEMRDGVSMGWPR